MVTLSFSSCSSGFQEHIAELTVLIPSLDLQLPTVQVCSTTLLYKRVQYLFFIFVWNLCVVREYFSAIPMFRFPNVAYTKEFIKC